MDDLELIRAALTYDVTPPDPENRARVRKLLVTPARVTPLRGGRHPRGLQIAAGGAAIVALIALQLIMPPRLGGPDVSAADGLRALARAAAVHPARQLEPGEYAFQARRITRTEAGSDPLGRHHWNYEVDLREEIWLDHEGGGRLHRQTFAPRFLTPADREAWIAAGRPILVQPGSELFELTPVRMTRLPLMHPDGRISVSEYIEQWARGDEPGAKLEVATEILRWGAAPARARAAVLQYLAGLPGISIGGDASDPEWRRGFPVLFIDGDTRVDLLFDPATSLLIARRDFVRDATGEWFETVRMRILMSDVVHSLPEDLTKS